MKLLLLFILLSFSAIAEEANVQLKPGGAVSAFVKEDGFKLTEKAMKNLGIGFQSLKAGESWEIPKSALVKIKHSTGVYRRYDNWITMVLVQVQNKSESTVMVKSLDLQAGDDVAVSGVSFLRMTDADLNSDTVDACAH